MDNLNKKCEECGKDLKSSQYARRKKEGEIAIKDDEDFVCRNPNCKKAEKDFPHNNS